MLAKAGALGVLSGDTLGFEGGNNVYAYVNQRVLNWLDPSGNSKDDPTIKVNPVKPKRAKNYLNPKCPTPSASTDFKFSLNKWPCKGNKGWYIQEVKVECSIRHCAEEAAELDSFVYYEAWPVTKGSALPSVLDTAIFSYYVLSEGNYKQSGTVRFYCEETLLANGGTPNWKPGRNQKINQTSRCATTSGTLNWYWNNQPDDHPELDTPDFWNSSKGDAGEGVRSFTMDWDCCCDIKEQFAHADADPKWTSSTK